MATKQAIFAAGCFWGVQTAFDEMPGVLGTTVGYVGGHLDAPTYEQVCTGQTGHAEAIQVDFDDEVISFTKLLSAFFKLHDPTQLNRQGPDVGTQYRSAIFPTEESQRSEALAFILSANFGKPVVTTVEPFSQFWPAEDYHQKYLEKRGLASCHIR